MEKNYFYKKKLSKQIINSIWKHQIVSIIGIIILISVIYITYRVFLIKVVMKDVSQFLKGLQWEQEKLTGIFNNPEL
jgi:hypothetical protein